MATTKKITDEHLRVFRDECLRLQRDWGLMDWKLYFAIGSKKGTDADCSVSPPDRYATLRLTKEWQEFANPLSDNALRESAKHEMLHVLLAPLETLLEERWLTRGQADEAGHAVIQRLMKLL